MVADDEELTAGADRGAETTDDLGEALERRVQELRGDQVVTTRESRAPSRSWCSVRTRSPTPASAACAATRSRATWETSSAVTRQPWPAEPDRVGTFAGTHVEGAPGRQRRGVLDQARVGVAAPDPVGLGVPGVPGLLGEQVRDVRSWARARGGGLLAVMVSAGACASQNVCSGPGKVPALTSSA